MFINQLNCCLIDIIISRNSFFIAIHVFIVNKISTNPILIENNIENNTMYSMQELHLFLCSFLPAIFISSTVSAHS